MNTPKKLRIGPRGITDMGDLVQVARAEGRRALRVKKVRMLPWVVRDNEGNFVVEVEEDGR